MSAATSDVLVCYESGAVSGAVSEFGAWMAAPAARHVDPWWQSIDAAVVRSL